MPGFDDLEIHSLIVRLVSKDKDFIERGWIKVKVYLTIVDCDLHDDLDVLDLFDAAVPPDGLLSATSALLET